tara:strand:+ start:1543 stop:1743 length:201 start_codon:yes stop_codon:yes gene_type:complete
MEKVKINTENVFVVTRDGRRIEPESYTEEKDAQIRAAKLVEVLKKWKDPDVKKVGIVKTKYPNTIT